MRLFLLPISTRRSLIYCQKRIPTSSVQITWWNNPIEKVTTKGSETWLEWEKYKEGWRKKVTVYGNKLFQRLPFEEWALKSVPPLTAKRKEEELLGKIKSRVEYPGTILNEEAVQDAVQRYGSHDRQSFHKKWFWLSVFGMPLSAPFMLVPVVPNLPFFYLVFRTWSHWRARCGSEHIEFLIKNKLLEKTSSSVLDTAYAVNRVGVSVGELQQDMKKLSAPGQGLQKSDTKTSEPAEQLLLSKADGVFIADCLQIPELAPEIERAVWQVEKALESHEEPGREKAKLESAEEKNERSQ